LELPITLYRDWQLSKQCWPVFYFGLATLNKKLHKVLKLTGTQNHMNIGHEDKNGILNPGEQKWNVQNGSFHRHDKHRVNNNDIESVRFETFHIKLL